MTAKPAGYYVKDICDRCGKWRQTIPTDHRPTDDWRFVRSSTGSICRTCARELDKASR
jgi:hypothetical protein